MLVSTCMVNFSASRRLTKSLFVKYLSLWSTVFVMLASCLMSFQSFGRLKVQFHVVVRVIPFSRSWHLIFLHFLLILWIFTLTLFAIVVPPLILLLTAVPEVEAALLRVVLVVAVTVALPVGALASVLHNFALAFLGEHLVCLGISDGRETYSISKTQRQCTTSPNSDSKV